MKKIKRRKRKLKRIELKILRRRVGFELYPHKREEMVDILGRKKTKIYENIRKFGNNYTQH